jgi:hypothetical protein
MFDAEPVKYKPGYAKFDIAESGAQPDSQLQRTD